MYELLPYKSYQNRPQAARRDLTSLVVGRMRRADNKAAITQGIAKMPDEEVSYWLAQCTWQNDGRRCGARGIKALRILLASKRRRQQ